MFQISTSSEKGSVKSTGLSDLHVAKSVQSSKCDLLTYTKTATIAFQTSEEDDFAVDDCSFDDSSEPGMRWLLFRRIAPQVGQQQQKSLITLMLENARNQLSTSDKSSSEVPWSNVQHTPTTHDCEKTPASLSPRTTRRSMHATELTGSLRFGLVMERQQEAFTTDTFLKRRQTLHDSVNLRRLPDKPCMKASEDVNASLWKNFFLDEASRDHYHSRGW
ncbi:hypothetical protein CDD83_82 [Cordyceps sp. RAO-2017]|nr:hypothetical protein CDD83_82 [Cordyceps sp. RAO-2017]